MSWVEETLSTFGRGLRFGELRFNGNGVVCLSFEKGETLYLEQHDGGVDGGPESVLIYLSKQVPPYQGGWRAKALALCHYSQGWPLDVHAGAREDQLVFLIRVPGEQFAPPTLERAIELLFQLHDTVQEGS